MSGLRYAFSLSKQQVAEAESPGTVRLIEHHEASDTIHHIPQPSHSPADPLNWPTWRKLTILGLMSFYCGAVNFGSAGVAPALQIMAPQLRQPFNKLSHLVAVNVLLIGVSNIFWVPLANTFGRRPILLLAMLIATLASMWAGLCGSQEFDSLLAARAVQGLGFGPADSIAANVVGEIFFVHQRGRAMAVYTIFLAGGSFIGGLGGGYIAGIQGYKYIFWITTALLAFVFLGQLFLVPETSFDRDAQYGLEYGSTTAGDADSVQDEKTTIETVERTMTRGVSVHGSFTYAQSLKIGVYRGHLLKNFLGPWRSLAFPGTWVVMLHYGGLLGGLVTISTVGPQFLAMPPYLWGNNVGLLNLGGLIGCFLGGAATYFIVDRLTKGAAKKAGHHGLAEPESRLPAMFPALFVATTGIWTFGFSAAHPSEHAWAGLCVGLGMVGFGITQIPSVGLNYLIDAYRPLAADCLVMTTIARAVVSFAWTFFVAQWIESAGPALPFGIFGMLMGIFSLLTVPLWLFGKRLRIATEHLLPKEGRD